MEGDCGGGDFDGYQAGGFESLGGAGFNNDVSGFGCDAGGYTAGVPEVLQGGDMYGGGGGEVFNTNPIDIPEYDTGEGNLDVMEMQTKMMKKALKDQQKQMKQFEKQQQKWAKDRAEQLKKEQAEKKKKEEEAKQKAAKANKAKPKPKVDSDSDSDNEPVIYRKNWKSPQQRQREAAQQAARARQMETQRYMQSQHQLAMQQQALQQQQAMLWHQMNFGGGEFY